jgi:TadE-like protein
VAADHALTRPSSNGEDHRFRCRRREEERGTVTAEAALVLPIIALFAMALLWMLSIGIAKVETIDAARDAVRSIARGDSPDTAAATARRTAPAGASVSVAAGASGSVRVTVSVEAKAPGWLLVPLPSVAVESTATMPVEGD